MELNEPYHLFSEPGTCYDVMLNDIKNARKYVYIETFRWADDETGRRFLYAVTNAAHKGVKVKILIDYWGGSSVRGQFFNPLKKAGGEIRFFEKIKINFDLFTKSHRRNHRKLLIVDDEIVYIGSANITGYNLKWRESILRMYSKIAATFKKIFLQDFKLYNSFVVSRSYLTKTIYWHDFTIVRDVPNIAIKKTNRAFIEMIRRAGSSITIETPYFLPGFLLRRALVRAAKKGVDVKVIIPKKSDVNLVDILRNKYLGPLSKHGVNFLFYEPGNLHAKLMLVDDSEFAVGSSNMDFRSFRYMFEIVLIGKQSGVAQQIKKHVDDTVNHTVPFVYETWKNRPFMERFFEWLLVPFRHLL